MPQDLARNAPINNLNRRSWRIGVPAGAALLAAGCGLASIGGQAAAQRIGPAVTLTQATNPAALLVVLAGPASGAISGLVANTAWASEDVRILLAGTPTKTIVAANSPAPIRIVIPCRR